jgi:hypothetical protein
MSVNISNQGHMMKPRLYHSPLCILRELLLSLSKIFLFLSSSRCLQTGRGSDKEEEERRREKIVG